MSIKYAVIIAAAALALPSYAMAQGTIRGAEEGADQGAAAAGPVGGVVGGAVGAATGTVGGILGTGGQPCGSRSVTRTDPDGNSETRTSSNCR